MQRMDPAREIAQRVTRRVNLIVMPAIGKGQQLGQPTRQPWRILGHMVVPRLKARRLRQEASLLADPWLVQDGLPFPRPTKVLGDRSPDVGVLDDRLVRPPGL